MEQILGLSTQAGQDMCVEYAHTTRNTAHHIYLVRGESGPAETLHSLLKSRGLPQVIYPRRGEAVEI